MTNALINQGESIDPQFQIVYRNACCRGSASQLGLGIYIPKRKTLVITYEHLLPFVTRCQICEVVISLYLWLPLCIACDLHFLLALYI